MTTKDIVKMIEQRIAVFRTLKEAARLSGHYAAEVSMQMKIDTLSNLLADVLTVEKTEPKD